MSHDGQLVAGLVARQRRRRQRRGAPPSPQRRRRRPSPVRHPARPASPHAERGLLVGQNRAGAIGCHGPPSPVGRQLAHEDRDREVDDEVDRARPVGQQLRMGRREHVPVVRQQRGHRGWDRVRRTEPRASSTTPATHGALSAAARTCESNTASRAATSAKAAAPAAKASTTSPTSPSRRTRCAAVIARGYRRVGPTAAGRITGRVNARQARRGRTASVQRLRGSGTRARSGERCRHRIAERLGRGPRGGSTSAEPHPACPGVADVAGEVAHAGADQGCRRAASWTAGTSSWCVPLTAVQRRRLQLVLCARRLPLTRRHLPWALRAIETTTRSTPQPRSLAVPRRTGCRTRGARPWP